jgi:hypothetical protein
MREVGGCTMADLFLAVETTAAAAADFSLVGARKYVF